jgi:hypothetical protein
MILFSLFWLFSQFNRLSFLMSELGNSAFWSDWPAFTSRGECDSVVVVVVKRFPICSSSWCSASLWSGVQKANISTLVNWWTR